MPGFIGGLAEGLQGLPQEVGQMLEARRQRQAAAALAAWAASQGQQPPPQAGPPPGAPPSAALAALGPKPQGGPAPGPPAPLPASGPPPQAGPAPQAGPPPQAGPSPQPQQPPPPNPELSATAQPDQKFADPVQEAQQSLGALIRSIKAANPKIDPRTLMDAVHVQLEDMKGILPTTRAVMQGQVQLLRQQVDMQFKYTKLNDENERFAQKLTELAKRHAEQAEFDKARETHMSRIDAINSARERDYSESVGYQHEDRQSAESGRNTRSAQTNNTRRYVADTSNETREDISGQRSSDSSYRSDQSFRGSAARNGQDAGPAPRRAGNQGLPADARKAPDGHYYVKRRGKFFRVDP